VLKAALDRGRLGRIGEAAADAHGGHLLDRPQAAVADALGDLDVDRIGGHLVIDEEAPLLLGRALAGGADRQAPRHVNRNGLSHVHVKASLGHGHGLLRKEVRRGFA
jgi:hypothetical protein